MNERDAFVATVLVLYGTAAAVAVAGFATGEPFLGFIAFAVATMVGINTEGDS